MSGIYNKEKLPTYFPEFKVVRVLSVGAGAVGSEVAEALCKMGIGHITEDDMDDYDESNFSKSSCLIRYPDDLNRNKAKVVSDRLKPIMVDGANSNYICGEISLLGPRALANYDYIFVALDNYAAKVYLNQIWLQIPENERPILIMGGTFEECASSVQLDGSEFCLRCCFDEKWLEDSLVRTSCADIHYRLEDGNKEIVRTSGLASSIAANLMCEQLRDSLVGEGKSMNRMLYYTPFPRIGISFSEPMKKKNCPDCKRYRPYRNLQLLKGDVLHSTLYDVVCQISEKLGTEDYSILVHQFEYAGDSYKNIIMTDYCRKCGKEITNIFRHEGRTSASSIVCDECKDNNREDCNITNTLKDTIYKEGKSISGIRPGSEEFIDMSDKTMFSLGWPIGGIIEVKQMHNAFDMLDDGYELSYFAFIDDANIIFNDLDLMKEE